MSYLANAAAALLVIVLLAPLWLALAIAIKIESPGPVLYSARRIGRNGTPFAMYKFRKMYDGASGALLTQSNDARFTRIGSFLASTKLDELPQLLNVIAGQMRFVGPRPEDPAFVERHRRMFAPVLAAHPGITGLCQIVYRNESSLFSGEDFESWYERTLLPHKIIVDRAYVRNRSAILDLRIVFWTMVAIVKPVSVDIDAASGRIRFATAEHAIQPSAITGPPEPALDDFPMTDAEASYAEATVTS